MPKFQLGQAIGKGGFAQVFRAVDASGRVVAIKVIDKKKLVSDDMRMRVTNEYKIHSELSHPHVVKFIDHGEDAEKIYFVLEYCENGDLTSYLRRLGRNLTEKEVVDFFSQIVAGVQYLHLKGVMHRDLSINNIMVSKDLKLKIGDFGLACRLGGVHSTLVGTPNYMAPEFVSRDVHGQECDVWSLGCILYRFLVGYCPFDSDSIPNTFDRIRRGNYKLPDDIPADAANLINKLLRQNPNQRLQLDEIRHHPFVVRVTSASTHQASRILNDSTDSGRPNSTLLTSTTSSGGNPPPLRPPLINVQPSSSSPYRPRTAKNRYAGLAPVSESDIASSIHSSPTSFRKYHYDKQRIAQYTTATSTSSNKENSGLRSGVNCFPNHQTVRAASTTSSPCKTNASSVSGSSRPPKLCTRRLEPCRAPLENATFSIVDGGTVVVEKVDDGGLHITEIVEISPDGESIAIVKISQPDHVPLQAGRATRIEEVPRSVMSKPPRSYTYATMRRSLFGMYRFAANIVEFHRQTTPKVIINNVLNGHYIRCFLMETLTDCVVEFPRLSVTFRFTHDGSIRLEDSAKAVMLIQPRDASNSEELIPEARRSLYRNALAVRQSAIELERTLAESAVRDNLDEDLIFPLESGRRLNSSSGANNRSRRSRAMSVMNMISSSMAATSSELIVTDGDEKASVLSAQMAAASSPVVRSRMPRSGDAASESGGTASHISSRRAKSLSRESANQSASYRSVGKENFFPGIGWVTAEHESSGVLFVVRFLTGCRVQYFSDRTLEVTDENGESHTYESHAHLPETVRVKMTQFLKKMTEIGFER